MRQGRATNESKRVLIHKVIRGGDKPKMPKGFLQALREPSTNGITHGEWLYANLF